jgi:uncharacterized protein YutE (UPF0331/DUF86 family)
LQRYIAELEKLQRVPFDDFQADFTLQLATERAFQASIESCVDIASHLISTYQLGQPQESRDVFRLLVQAGYITQDYGEAMMAMVSFRNRLVHLYWDVDLERLYTYLQTDIDLLQQFYVFGLALLQADE